MGRQPPRQLERERQTGCSSRPVQPRLSGRPPCRRPGRRRAGPPPRRADPEAALGVGADAHPAAAEQRRERTPRVFGGAGWSHAQVGHEYNAGVRAVVGSRHRVALIGAGLLLLSLPWAGVSRAICCPATVSSFRRRARSATTATPSPATVAARLHQRARGPRRRDPRLHRGLRRRQHPRRGRLQHPAAAPTRSAATASTNSRRSATTATRWAATAAPRLPDGGVRRRRAHPDSEECDDGNTGAGDGCAPDCTSEPEICGNGIDELPRAVRRREHGGRRRLRVRLHFDPSPLFPVDEVPASLRPRHQQEPRRRHQGPERGRRRLPEERGSRQDPGDRRLPGRGRRREGGEGPGPDPRDGRQEVRRRGRDPPT